VVLSKRERYVATVTILAVLILGLDQFFIDPLLKRKEMLDSRIATAQEQLDRASRLFTTSRAANRKWSEMTHGGLRHDASEAESLVLHSVRDWAQDAGMSLSSVKPERTEKEKEFYRITIRATGTGGMAQVGQFLWRIKTASVPVRITDLSINSRKEGTDDLAVQLGISTIYLAPETDKSKSAALMTRELLP
jgi:Tfp pilus assembly protein PilO